MKMFLFAVAMTITTAPTLAADVGVSISIGQPGFYGHIDIGDFPQPQLIYPTPMIIQRVPVNVARPPIYLHVPPGHAKNWRKHCRKYNACGQPVYFVQESWYNDEYVPRYSEKHGKGSHESGNRGNRDGRDNGGRGNGNGKHKNKHKD